LTAHACGSNASLARLRPTTRVTVRSRRYAVPSKLARQNPGTLPTLIPSCSFAKVCRARAALAHTVPEENKTKAQTPLKPLRSSRHSKARQVSCSSPAVGLAPPPASLERDPRGHPTRGLHQARASTYHSQYEFKLCHKKQLALCVAQSGGREPGVPGSRR
jgi:hypothetical protein